MARLLGADFEAFLTACSAAPADGLRVNTLKITPEAFQAISPFTLQPVPWAPAGFLLGETPPDGSDLSAASDIAAPGKHPYHAAGLYYLQEPSAMAAAELLAPRPGERVLDLAAAPGGKATHIAALMGNAGLLVANEIHRRRVQVLAGNLERWGARCAVITNESPEQLADRFAGFFDRVLLDAPCSGEWMFRKSQAALRDWSPRLVRGCALRQSRILDQAARMVRPGGRLAYVTCTFAPEENEGVVAAFLRTHPDFAIAELAHRPGFADGRPDWVGAEADLPELRRAVRLWPHRAPGEGHFIALLQRVGGESGSTAGRWRGERIPVQARQRYDAFCREVLAGMPAGESLALVGIHLYALPPDLPDLAGLRVLHPGWWLGTIKKDRFEPSHALALGLSPAEARADRIVNLASEGHEVRAYLRGASIPSRGSDGWVLVTADGFPLGWGRRSGGEVKSHYPRGLRY